MCGWAGAKLQVTRALAEAETKNRKNEKLQTDQRTNGRTKLCSRVEHD